MFPYKQESLHKDKMFLKVEMVTYLSLCPLDWQIDYTLQTMYLFTE